MDPLHKEAQMLPANFQEKNNIENQSPNYYSKNRFPDSIQKLKRKQSTITKIKFQDKRSREKVATF
jgi:hypothetical protein